MKVPYVQGLASRLIKERGVLVAQTARDLDVHENVLRK